MTAPDWASVLHLASEWDFPSIRELAIQSFTPSASDVDKVVLGHRYRFEEWLLPGYTGLVERKEPLTLEEGMRLTVEDIISINKAREEIRAASSSASTGKIEMSQDIYCQYCCCTHMYTYDSTRTTTKWQGPSNLSHHCIQNAKPPTITSNSPPSSTLPSTAAISQKVKTLIPRSSLSYVPGSPTHCDLVLIRLSVQFLKAMIQIQCRLSAFRSHPCAGRRIRKRKRIRRT